MDSFCRACLVQFDDSSNLYPYSEKNRRLFVYSTGLQVKQNDNILFQVCKDCYSCMKSACTFKKNCRTAERKLRSYFLLKEDGDSIDLASYLKNYDDTLKFRLPLKIGSSTPASHRREDDNESTCTSIQNFMTDILPPEEIPDNEAKIIREVIEEEADILEDSLDSHWLQDDSSVDTDNQFDFSFSPFATPRLINDDHCYTPIKPLSKDISDKDVQTKYQSHNKVENFLDTHYGDPLQKLLDTSFNSPLKEIIKQNQINNSFVSDKICSIDFNLDNALKKDTECISLDLILTPTVRDDISALPTPLITNNLILTPTVRDDISAPATPLITNILFGDKIDDEVFDEKENEKQIEDEIAFIEDFLKAKEEIIVTTEEIIDAPGIETLKNISPPLSNMISPLSNIVSPLSNIVSPQENIVSPQENKFCITNFYCKMCKKQFRNLKGLKIHSNKYHKMKINATSRKKGGDADRKKMICDYCGKCFQVPKYFIKHLEKHNNPAGHKCRYCPLKFTSKVKMNLHCTTHTGIKVQSTREAKYVCSVCGKAFVSSSNCATHMNRHNRKFKHACSECGMDFLRKSELENHMRRHTGERPFRCTLCLQSFSRTDTLNRHMKRHTGELPFPCNFCHKKFGKASELKEHQRVNKECLKLQPSIAEEEDSD